MVRVKICGITNLEDAKLAAELGADALGFVFAESPRGIKPVDAGRITAGLPPFVNFIGVFVNAPIKTVEKIIKVCKIDTLQFHGEEPPEYCAHFRKAHNVLKAFRIKDKNSLRALSAYDVTGYLLDAFAQVPPAAGQARGGTGRTFDWQLAKEAKRIAGPVILSGGLNPRNVKDAIEIAGPYAVDVSSGVESQPGKKDFELMKEFMKAVKDEKTS